MASKLEQTVLYIQAMEIGQKISIKRIAKELSISEGTAYHAIKRAEQQGLVVTLPRAGTTRVQASAQAAMQPLTMNTLKEMIDANVLLGDSAQDFDLNSVCIGDSNAQDLAQALESGGRDRLCIIGDRPELQKQAVESGAHLLLTGFAKLYEEVRQTAARNKCVVLQTWYSSFHVLNLLSNNKNSGLRYSVPTNVREWMQPPQHLFLDDLIFDSNRIFEDYLIFDIPVVDNEMRVCGSLNAVNSYSTDLSQRVKNIYTPDSEFIVMQETDLMADAAEYMISGGANLVLVQKDDRLTGMLTQNDVLQFYQYYGIFANGRAQGSAFKPTEKANRDGKQLYTVRVPFSEASNGLLKGDNIVPLLISAVNTFCREQNISGTIHSMDYLLHGDVSLPTDLTAAVEAVSSGAGRNIIECSLLSKSTCCAKATVVITDC